MVLLNVAVFGVAGVLGLSFLLQTLHRISIAEDVPEIGVTEATPPTEFPSAIHRIDERAIRPPVRMVFRIWLVVFALVGAQMGWVLRPFIGAPGKEFTWLRPVESNFFEAMGNVVVNFFK
jgi:hypothetical protein